MNRYEENNITTRGVVEIIPEEDFKKRLALGTPMRLKMGFDPTARDVTLGWAVGLRKLKQFQELGHQVILVVGYWTAQIGDPTNQSATRHMLSAEEVQSNAENCLRQFYKIVDRTKTQVVWQSEWFGKFGLKEVIQLASRFTVAKFLSREDFANRFAQGRPITLAELLYPILQAYDSVAIQADVEFGGTDQKFNCLAGRDLQEAMGQPPQQVFLMPLLPGTDGRKMSQSFNNYIGVEESPNDMFGKIMSITDDLIPTYFELLTDVPDKDLIEIRNSQTTQGSNPIDLKKHLGHEIVAQFHTPVAASQAQAHFERVYQRRQTPEDIQDILVSGEDNGVHVELPKFLAAHGLVSSRGEAKRLLNQGGVQIDGQRVMEDPVFISYGSVIKIGRHKWARVTRA